MEKYRIVVLISGRGSNMTALADYISSKNIPIEISLVLSDKKDAPGIAHAKERGIKTKVVPRLASKRSKEDFFKEISDCVKKFNPELIVLAGFMRVLTKEFINDFPNKIINIHPSLLPNFKGLHPQQQALEAGVKVSGCTVHFVNEEVDAGEIIAQVSVPVFADDNENTLSSRILEQEHAILPQIVEQFSQGKISINAPRALASEIKLSNKGTLVTI